MKHLFRSVLKTLFVVVLPILFIIGAYMILTMYETSAVILITLLLVGIAVVANSVVYLVFMSKVRMLPKASIEVVPIFGFAFGVDPHHKVDEISWLLLLPFVSIEFRSKK